MTSTETKSRPAVSTDGLGELIRAHRLYLGLTQRAMADQLGKARRDYQRIENNQDRCPPGLLTTIEALSDRFDDEVDAVIEAALAQGGAALAVTSDEALADQNWDRNVAGRAAILADHDHPGRDLITLHLSR